MSSDITLRGDPATVERQGVNDQVVYLISYYNYELNLSRKNRVILRKQKSNRPNNRAVGEMSTLKGPRSSLFTRIRRDFPFRGLMTK